MKLTKKDTLFVESPSKRLSQIEELQEIFRYVFGFDELSHVRQLLGDVYHLFSFENQRLRAVQHHHDPDYSNSDLARKLPFSNMTLDDIVNRYYFNRFKANFFTPWLHMASFPFAVSFLFGGDLTGVGMVISANMLLYISTLRRGYGFPILKRIDDVRSHIFAVLDVNPESQITNRGALEGVLSELESLLKQYKISEEQHIIQCLFDFITILRLLRHAKSSTERNVIIQSHTFIAKVEELSRLMADFKDVQKMLSTATAHIRDQVEAMQALEVIDSDVVDFDPSIDPQCSKLCSDARQVLKELRESFTPAWAGRDLDMQQQPATNMSPVLTSN